jgi:phosphoglycerate dehydrogenase-like enzyme
MEVFPMHIFFKTPLGRKWRAAINTLKEAFPDVSFSGSGTGEAADLENADAIVAGELTPEEIHAAKRLKMVFVPYAGVDALPLPELRRRHIRVANVHVNAPFVAERAIALALAFYGKIIEYHNDMKRGQWHGYWAGLGVKDTWESIRGRPCAVLGTGEIGSAIARHLKGFDCPVYGFKKHPPKTPLKEFDAVTLDLWEAVEKSEPIFVCLPLTRGTRGILDEWILKKMSGKFLVNVGRGELIDEKAFFEALKSGV